MDLKSNYRRAASVNKSPRVIAVIGMHRSGTSAMTRALGYIGANLGHDFIETMPEVNAKGFWEDATLNALNIKVLNTLGIDWLTNRSIPRERFDEADLLPLQEEAAKILRTKLENSAVFAFKDPRTSILLPFWKRAFASVEIVPSYLVALRNPISVAESLRIRDGFDSAKSAALWLNHTLQSLMETQGERRVVVDYDLLMERPVIELRRIARILTLSSPSLEGETEFASQFLATELRHCYSEDGASAANSGMPAITMSLFSILLKVARDELDLEAPPVRDKLAEVTQFISEIQAILAYADTLELAAAAGANQSVSSFPWLPVLRSSFGLETDAPPASPISTQTVETGHRLSQAIRRLVARTSRWSRQ